MLGIASRSAASRSHGSSAEEAQRDVVGRAAPALDADSSCGVVRATCRATATRSRVRTRVASSDWCASRNVVSVTATAVCARSSAANPLGPELEQALAAARRGAAVEVDGGQLVARVDAASAPSPCGLLTVTSASQVQQLGAAVGADRARVEQARAARR